MVGRKYEGAWRRNNQYFEVPSAVQIVNRDIHSAPGQTPETGWKDTHTAPMVEVDPAVEYIGDDLWQYGYDSGEPGTLIDQTPVDHSHAGSHSLNEGAPQARVMRKELDVRGPGETYGENRWEDFGPKASEISHEALMRGVNSAPQNNPPLAMYDGKGFRQGFQEFLMRGRDRRFLVKPKRTEHGARAVHPNTAFIPPESSYDQEVPLWSSLASTVDRRLKRPMMRRTPPDLSETIMEDGGGDADDSFSVIGVF